MYYLELLRASEGTLSHWVPAAFAVVSTHQPALGPRGCGPFFLCVIHKEGLCLGSGDINRLMMVMMIKMKNGRRNNTESLKIFGLLILVIT
jgi:hypothetical protein